MTNKEIEERISKIETALWYEEMADYMNWKRYYELKDELAKLKKMLKDF